MSGIGELIRLWWHSLWHSFKLKEDHRMNWFQCPGERKIYWCECGWRP